MGKQEMTRDEYIQTTASIFLDGGLSIKALMLMAMDWERNRICDWLYQNNYWAETIEEKLLFIDELRKAIEQC